ncbi:MAG: F0F1 ATP synthase subunit delta [Pseudomonadales bacterium]|nr:F0F1 ATP synthase subunit delta [Pseudomonadales bacterium]
MAEAELTTVARPYARAAFSQALNEASGLETWSRMLRMMAATVQHKTVAAALSNPKLTREQEASIMTELLGEELNDFGKNFISILTEYGRLTLLPEIAHMYELLKANHEKTMDVEITSAFEVEATDLDRLAEGLKRKLQREVSLSAKVDPSLLGGVIIRAEDTVIDGSVRGKLGKLAQVMS